MGRETPHSRSAGGSKGSVALGEVCRAKCLFISWSEAIVTKRDLSSGDSEASRVFADKTGFDAPPARIRLRR